MRAFWYVMANLAPAALKLWAMAQAMLLLLATPKTIAFFPCIFSMFLFLSKPETQKDNRNGANGRFRGAFGRVVILKNNRKIFLRLPK
jgi:hypothetical protein